MANPKTTVRLNRVRLSFPHLFKAHAMNEGDKPAFSCQLLIGKDHPDLQKLKDAANAAAVDKWADKGLATLSALVKQNRIFLRDGDTKTNSDGDILDGYAGNMFVSARSSSRPTIIDQQRNPLDEQSGKPYAGSYVNALVSIWAQDGKFGKRVNAQIQGIQFAADGDSFGAGSVAAPEAFDVLDSEWGGDTANDDAAGLV